MNALLCTFLYFDFAHELVATTPFCSLLFSISGAVVLFPEPFWLRYCAFVPLASSSGVAARGSYANVVQK